MSATCTRVPVLMRMPLSVRFAAPVAEMIFAAHGKALSGRAVPGLPSAPLRRPVRTQSDRPRPGVIVTRAADGDGRRAAAPAR